MATDESSAPADDRDLPCSPCRGTGKLISNLGGSPQEVTCPWCEGEGRFLPGHDAQDIRRQQGQ